MSTVINRKAMEHWWGKAPAPDIAYGRKDHPGAKWKFVTWAEVMAARRQRQAERLERIYLAPQRRAVRISVRYFDQDFFGGWHCYIEGIGFSTWIRRGDDTDLMRRFPLANDWEAWKQKFVVAFKRGTFGGRPRGVAFCFALCNGNYVRALLEPIQS